MDRDTKPAEKQSFSLPPEQSRFIDRLVASSTFASSSEVIRAGLRALQERDAAVERWLREEVVPTYDRMQADPGRGISVTDVRQRLRATHLKRLCGRGAVTRDVVFAPEAEADLSELCLYRGSGGREARSWIRRPYRRLLREAGDVP